MLLTRYGLREWLTATIVAAALAAPLAWMGWWWAVGVAGLAWLAFALFFRDPLRRIPDAPPGVMLSPADGRVLAVDHADRHEALGGPAVVVRIFLSVLDVHVNRVPCAGEVLAQRRAPGKFLDARSPRCPAENESNLVTLRLPDGRVIGVRQVVGKIARRIVCDLEPGQRVKRGERMGMIKFGSGTELILPRDQVTSVEVAPGDRVKGGITRVATLRP
jgi:phosphatidylserine decarboxylase